MRITRLIMFLMSGFFLMIGCNNNSNRRLIKVGKDTVHSPKAEDTDTSTYDACYEDFFKGLPRFDDSSGARLVWSTGKRKSLTQFFKDEFMSAVSQYGKKDLDGDGTTELIVFNYTGGPHCCDEYYFFSQKNEKEFEYRAHLMGGQACIEATTNTISYSLSETFGYFFSCYACGFSDSSGAFKTMREIQLKYTGARLEVVAYDTLAAKQNIINLRILNEHGFEKIEGLMDNGWRKEFAINLAIWHYNHNKNWKQTKKLFEEYYTFNDAPRVWTEFHRTMVEAGKENSF